MNKKKLIQIAKEVTISVIIWIGIFYLWGDAIALAFSVSVPIYCLLLFLSYFLLLIEYRAGAIFIWSAPLAPFILYLIYS